MSLLAKLIAEAPGENGLARVTALPLEDEPGLGALTIGGYLREVAQRHGPAEAVCFNTGGTRLSWSYEELWRQSFAVARALVSGGLGKDERVGILMTNRPEFVAAFFGIAMAGGTAVALSTFSTEQELAHLLEASQVSTLLFERQVLATDFAEMLQRIEPLLSLPATGPVASVRFPYLRNLVAVGDCSGEPITAWDTFLSQGRSIPDALIEARINAVVPTDPGAIFFSSGTTSLPKGIVHDQRAFAIQWWRWPRLFAMNEPVRAWTGNGFFWSGNISMVIGAAFSSGGCVVLQPYFEAEEALRLIEAERVSFANGRPHQWARLQSAEGWDHADLSSLKYVPRGEILWTHNTVDTDWEVPQAFGTTETMSICTCIGRAASEEDYAGSFGVPLPGNVLKIVDPLTGEPVRTGEHGEMCIKGPTLMRGYLGKAPEQCFDDEGFYRTGDGGHVDSAGRFYWEGRLTGMIKTGGANVAPEEIDEIVANWPGVKRVQTVGVGDELLGERVVTCIVPLSGHTIDEAGLLAELRGKLASYKVPRQILLCSEDDFAITGNEKVKPLEVREMAQKRLAEETA